MPGIPRVANVDGSFKDGNEDVKFNKGDLVFASTYTSGRVSVPPTCCPTPLTRWVQDPTKFPNPEAVNINRDPSLYSVFGSGMHNCRHFC